MEKWKNAVVNLDCKNQRGTALFLSHNSKRYLLTAKHVVWDTESAEREFNDEFWWLLSSPGGMQPRKLADHYLEIAGERAFNKIFKKIKLVNPYGKKLVLENLINLQAGTPDIIPYTFDHEHDLAIISLDQRKYESRFVDILLELGYKQIPSSHILMGPSKEGADVFTVGYPVDVSHYDEIEELPKELENLVSKFISIPAFAFGKISQLKDDLHYFWVDISVYPGNSGGPIIENDKLVGIVTEQAAIKSDTDSNVEIRIPFGSVVKAEYVLKLIEEQEKKDNYIKELHKGVMEEMFRRKQNFQH